MTPTSRLYDALNDYLRQSEYQWRDVRHLKTLCWMVIGILESQSVHLSGFGVYVKSRAQIAQSHQRRFRRWLSNRRMDVTAVHQALMAEALTHWGKHRLYLSLDTTVVWNCFGIVWVGVVFRGRTWPVAWTIVTQASSTVRFMDDPTGAQTSNARHSCGSRGGFVSRPRVCRWQADEVSQRDPALALPYPHQTVVPIPGARAMAQSVYGRPSSRGRLLY